MLLNIAQTGDGGHNRSFNLPGGSTCAVVSSDARRRSSSGICIRASWKTRRAAVLSSSRFEALHGCVAAHGKGPWSKASLRTSMWDGGAKGVVGRPVVKQTLATAVVEQLREALDV